MKNVVMRKKVEELFENVEGIRFSYEDSVKNQIRAFIKEAGTDDEDELEAKAFRFFIEEGQIEKGEEPFTEEQARARVKGNLDLVYAALEDRERFHDQKDVDREYSELLYRAEKIGVYSDATIRHYLFADCMEEVLKELR